jgi:hypothetical protein
MAPFYDPEAKRGSGDCLPASFGKLAAVQFDI